MEKSEKTTTRLKENNLLKKIWEWYQRRRKLAKEKKKKPQTFGETIISWTKTIVGALIIVMFINGFLVASFVVPTGSMENTVMTGTFFL